MRSRPAVLYFVLLLCWTLAGSPAAAARARTLSRHDQVVHGENNQSGGLVGATVDAVTGTSCTNGARVVRAALWWFDYRKGALGTTKHKGTTLGYRCRARMDGDYVWRIWCTRGKRRITGWTNE